jgi:hypothetical protein
MVDDHIDLPYRYTVSISRSYLVTLIPAGPYMADDNAAVKGRLDYERDCFFNVNGVGW